MKKHQIEIYLAFLAVVLSAVLLRLVPHVPNVSPVAALALFSGAATPLGIGFIIPILVMLISDFFLGFHATIPFVYGSFLLIGGIGFLLRKKMTPFRVGAGSLVGSLLFFTITNFGVWATSSMYEKSINGLVNCYYRGLPFLRNTVLGDLFYATVFFLGYRIVKLLIVLMLPSAQKAERQVGNTV